jgi:hypothetical protein
MCVSQNPLKRLERMGCRDQMPDTLRDEPYKIHAFEDAVAVAHSKLKASIMARIPRPIATKNQADPATLRELGIHPDRSELTLEQRIARIEKALGIV